MNLILLGPQGSGKGTIAKRICADFGLVPISTGELFRESARKKEKLGLEAQKYMNKGELVPFDLTLKILKQRISMPDCKKGIILDGFPRTLEQAKALKDVLNIDLVINIDLPYDECIKRMIARRVCPECKESYSTLLGCGETCDKCGTKLVQRDDDKLDAIKHRLEVYDKTITPLINFYSDRLFKLSGLGSPEDIYQSVKNFLLKVGRN